MGGLLESIEKVYDLVSFYASNSVPSMEQIKQADLLKERADTEANKYFSGYLLKQWPNYIIEWLLQTTVYDIYGCDSW